VSADADGPPGPSPEDGPFLGEREVQVVRSGILTFVRERVERADATGVVVGLSGGVDSTLSATLAVEALGTDRVVGVSLPSHKTDRLEATEARTIAEGLGIEFEEVPLRSVLDRFEKTAGEALAPDADRRTVGNAAARLRMLCLYYHANARSRLVLGTANRSELLTGYFTKYGDGGADLFPLGGLYKTEVRVLADRAGVPRRIVAKPSTAGFWVGQTDAEELGAPYEVVDVLLHRIVDEGKSVESAIDDLAIGRSDAMGLLDRCVATAHKCQVPPLYAVGDRARADGRSFDRLAEWDRPPGVSLLDSEKGAGPAANEATRWGPHARTDSWTEAVDDATDDGDRDAVFMALADGYRRATLEILYDREEPVSPQDLVPAIVGRAAADTPSSETPNSAAGVSVINVHLPRLAGAGLVDYDREAGTLRLTELALRLRPVLEPLLG